MVDSCNQLQLQMKKIAFSAFLFLFVCGTASAQGYVATQRAQEDMIRKAYKRGRVTRNEYYKLMNEQDKIKETIYKYKRDGVITPHEQNVIEGKIARAEDRLARYKHNWER